MRGALLHVLGGAAEDGIIPAYAGSTNAIAIAAAKSPGIIPAYAGSTYSTYQRSVVIWDHPRVCGEHLC